MATARNKKRDGDDTRKRKSERPDYHVHGTVTGRDGKEVSGAKVTVWWKRIRKSLPLASGRTSEKGGYRLRYRPPEDAPVPLLVIVEARSERLGPPLVSAATQAQKDLEINLQAQAADQSEFTVLLKAMKPLLDRLPLLDVVESPEHQDISFLAQELGKTTEQIMRVVVAVRLEAAFGVPAAAFYAFLRQRVPSGLPSPLLDASNNFTLIVPLVQNIGSMIFALSADVEQRTLTAAVALDLIGPQFTKDIPALVSQLQALRSTDLLNHPYLVGNTTLSQLLGVASLPQAKQQTFSQALATNTQTMRNFWRTLGDGQHGFTAAEASGIERTLSIGAFVKNFVPLIQTLTQGFAAGTYRATSDLARLSLQDWVQLVNQTGAPPGIDGAGTANPAQVFASVVYTRVTRAYPTASLSGRIATAKLVPQAQQQPLAQFFQNNPELELTKDNIAAYLAGKGPAALAGINEKDQPAVISVARSFQRVLRVAPSADVCQTLLGLGINSATQIATLGEQQFFLKATAAGLTKPEANQVYQVAAQRYAGVVSLYMKMNVDAVGVWPKAMGDLSGFGQATQQAIQRDPSLATLFGSQDYCAIDDCTSILSPAAYLCDLLLWLRNHPQGGQTALDVLDSRRPDIRNLLLNCPNSDTELPYIDLVNELLADKISPPTDPSSTINPPWKQTTEEATAAELSAAPQYFNQAAYVTLFGASYPWSLPYSTGLDELRTYLQQWNLPLWQLRQALLPVAGATVAQQVSVADEAFGMNVKAENLLSTPNVSPAFLATVWNTSDFSANPPKGLATVPVFLQAAAITYESMLELLQVAWVQGGLNVTLEGLNDLCDTSIEALAPAPLNPGFLDRAHRFLRLWDYTGYKMWELDLLLQAPSVGNGVLDQNALVALQSFWELKNETGLAVNQQLAFYQDIDTASHRDPDGTATTSLYAQIFLNPTVTWVAPDPDLANLPSGAVPADPNLSDHLKAIQPALGVSGADATTLFALTDNQLTLANLSLIYRANALAVASGFPVSDLLSVAGLLSPAAATPAAALAPLFASPAATLAFLAQAKNVQQSALSIDALTYLLTPPAATTLASAITAAQTSITVAGDAGFPPANFYIAIGSEILLVTAVGGAGNTTWTVLRGQQGTTAAPAAVGAAMTPSGTGGWATTTQMTQANITAALGAVQHSVASLLSASTSLAAPVTAAQTSLTVTSDVGFPPSNFYVYIGSEILLVTAAGGTGNTTWTVTRGQQGTAAAPAAAGAAVTPTSGDLDGTVVAAVATNAHSTGAAGLANDVTALILNSLQIPGGAQTLLAVLEDPALVAPTGAITIGGAPATGDALQTILADPAGNTATVAYTLTGADNGNVNQTALDFAQAINASSAVAGPNAFLAPCTASGAVVTLTALTPGAPGSNVTCASTAAPGGAGHVSVAPGTTAMNGLPTVTPASFPGQFLAIQLVDKVGVLVRGLKLVAADLAWLINNGTVYGGLDLTQLPVATGQPALGLSPLLTTLLAIKLARLFTAAPSSSGVQKLYDIIAGVHTGTLANAAQAQGALATITGWPLADIEAFAPGLGLAFPASYTQPAVYDALRTLESMAERVTAAGAVVAAAGTTLASPITAAQTSVTVASAIGFPPPNFYVSIGSEILLVTAVGGGDNTVWTVARGQQGTTAAAAASGAAVTQTLGAQIVTWGGVPLDEVSAEGMAASALGALKAQQTSNDAWLALAPTLMNPIRDRRSAALQAYLIGQRDGAGNLIYADADGLFDYFLIDVQMTSCQVTSRIVQAYIAVQIFVERCLMNLEAPAVVVDLTKDDTWNQWEWMKRYRVWEANREVFLYPENWLIESQRPNRTEIYQKFEQDVRQGQSTADYFETVVLNYIDRLDGLAHLLVTGTCEDPASGSIYVVARSLADPPVFYLRSYISGAWTGWTQIPLDIKAHQVVPAFYRGRVCLFWPDVKVANEPQQKLPPPMGSTGAPSQTVERYVTLGVYFSVFRNGAWAPGQTSKGKLFDKPLLDPTTAGDTKTVEALYTIKVQTPAPSPGYGANLWVDVFRFGDYNTAEIVLADALAAAAAQELAAAAKSGTSAADAAADSAFATMFSTIASTFEAVATSPTAVHVGRATFDGRFSDLELNNLGIVVHGVEDRLYTYAQSTYGPAAKPLLPLTAPEPDLVGEPGLTPLAGALETFPADASHGSAQTQQLILFPASGLDVTPPVLLNAAPLPFRVVGPNTDLVFDPGSFFFFQDNRRSYFVESPKYYWSGSAFLPVTPSDPGTVPYEIKYRFHPFYHPFTRLFWNQLAAGGFDLLFDPSLQQHPDQIDPSGADVFSFKSGYQPLPAVQWDHDDVTGQDRQFLDFGYGAAFSVYNWELFYHIPLYVAQLLSQNQQFEDAQTWFNYIFNPSRQGSDPVPQRFWIPKPLHNLTSAQILSQQINILLEGVNARNPSDVAEVEAWRNNPFNPFVLADQRQGVPYMKSTVMSYLDNLIAWGDNLFSTESREALSEATLIYVIANEILGPQPQAVTPPPHSDQSFEQLEPSLDAFANAMVEIENSIGGAGGAGLMSGGDLTHGGIPGAHTFYFKIPPNETLLGYWTTVADRLNKLRHCQNIAGAPLELALFDAPIDPGLLVRAQAAGVDLSSVLSDLGATLPNYRFTALYPQALDFVNAVRAYGTSLQAALEKSDAGALALLQQTTQQQLLADGSQVLDWQVQQAQDNIENLTQALALAQQKYDFNSSQSWPNAGEGIDATISAAIIVNYVVASFIEGLAGATVLVPDFMLGAAGFGGTPTTTATEGGTKIAKAGANAAASGKSAAAALERSAALARQAGAFERRQDNWDEAANEAKIQIAQAQAQLDGANLALQIAQQNQVLHQEQIDNIQKQIDFLNNKFTADSLYDWMVGSLSATYFQSYQLAYQMCKQVERCYQFELGVQNSSFIQFGYWDSLHKGLLAGETLNHDLRRMQSAYLQQNARRYELSRFVSLGLLDPVAFRGLLVSGKCDFDLPESLFDNDYPGHYNRRLVRVSMSVVYPNPGKFDNVKASLTMTANRVRIKTDTGPGYAEKPGGSDSRFIYSYAANAQKIAMGNAQDDPGLFITAISSNIVDQRYLPFENAGAVSSWHLEMQQGCNEVDLSTVGDVVLHLYYTALDGGATFQDAVLADNAARVPASGVKIFSALNDFAAPAATVANPYPLTPWQAFLAKPAPGSSQLLTLAISPAKFPAWTRGKTISVTSLTVVAVAWPPEPPGPAWNFVVAPQAPLPTAPVTMAPVTGVTEPNVCSGTITLLAGTPLGTWSFELQQQGAPDFASLTKNQIGDVFLLVNYKVS
jgi:hypothetical protein